VKVFPDRFLTEAVFDEDNCEVDTKKSPPIRAEIVFPN
jgi:hypothetical protein